MYMPLVNVDWHPTISHRHLHGPWIMDHIRFTFFYQSTTCPAAPPQDLPSVVRVILIKRARVLFGLRDGFAMTSTGSPILNTSLSTPCCANCVAAAPSIAHRSTVPLESATSTKKKECGERSES